MLLGELTATARRLALVGLAKNTGKTVAMTTVLDELAARGRRAGVTSVGRDGEERDVLDERIVKPRIRLHPDSLVATTDLLLRTSGVEHARELETGLRTSLGRVVIARLPAGGAVEVAGPASAHDVGAVTDAMLALGAEQVLIDGALDRRAGASPAFADGVVLSTGAALHRDLDEVVRRTRSAAELLRLPVATAVGDAIRLDGRLALDGTDAEIAALLRAHPEASHIAVAGALCEPFVEQVLRAARGRALTLVVADGTRVFLTRRSRDWYARQGLTIAAQTPIDLRAITVNPLAPRSHRLDSPTLRRLVAEAVPGVPVLDVMDPGYPRTISPMPREEPTPAKRPRAPRPGTSGCASRCASR
ncbi:MAG TPA: hypothetical protein VE972_13985 [Conexibacter sp.]|nr:hypothetical protein [Conexibacter sp.]